MPNFPGKKRPRGVNQAAELHRPPLCRISMGRDQSARIGALAKLAPGCAGGIAREMESNRPLPSSSYALAHGRLDTSSCQRVKYASFGAIFMSAKRPAISIATSAVMSAIVKRSPATNWCPFSSRSIRSRR